MQQQTRAMLFGLGAVLCWSTVATAFKLSLNYLQPAQLMLVAASTALLFFLGLLIYQGRLQRLWQQTPATYLRSLGYGAMNPLLYYLVLFSAYDRLPAQEAQVLNYSWAIVLSLLAVPMLKQAMHKADYLAAILCYAGVWVIATRGDVFALQFENGVGVLLALCSTVIWALYWIANRRDQREPVLGLCLNFLFAVPLITIYCAANGLLIGLPNGFAWQGIAGGVYVGLVEMGLGFILWLMAMRLTNSTARVANLIFISPFLSLIFIASILREPIYPSTLIALLFIIAGLWLQSHAAAKAEK